MIRVLLADDEHMIRTALAALLRLEEDIEWSPSAATAWRRSQRRLG